MSEVIVKYFDTPEKVAILVSSISALIAAVSTVTAIIANSRNDRQYKKSIEPQLSMQLVDFNSLLYLQVKNTGKTVARDISIIPSFLVNNAGNTEQPRKEGLFAMQFELYPDEVVQTEVGYISNNIETKAFPQLGLQVEYQVEGSRKKVSYERTVTFAPAYDNKIIADVNLDLRNVEKSMQSISRATVRAANYLDGCQVADYDELNILAGKTLANDIRSVFGKEEIPVMSRTELIEKRR